MSKLYFKYGCMGSSKSAQALITKFNYEERDMKVWLLKPSIDTRFDSSLTLDGKSSIRSRIGLRSEATVIRESTNILDEFLIKTSTHVEFHDSDISVIIVDESQFLSEEQIDQLRVIASKYNTPVICYGLRTDFQTKLFPGSKRLLEVADSIEEIKTMCKCGRKATVNARVNPDGSLITEGEQVVLGANDLYVPYCYSCYMSLKEK